MSTLQLISKPARVLAGLAAAVATTFCLGTSLTLAQHYASAGFEHQNSSTEVAQRVVVTAQQSS